MPAGPTPGLVFVQPHVALFRLELRFDVPPGTAHVGQSLESCVLGSVGQVVAGYPILKDNFLSTPSSCRPGSAPGRPKTKKPIRNPRRKPTVRKPAKKTKPKNQKPRPEPTQAEVEAKRQEQLEFDRQRSKTPERREQNRLRSQERRRSAKGLGPLQGLPEPLETGRDPLLHLHREAPGRPQEGMTLSGGPQPN